MDIPDLNWRDVLSVGAAVVSLTASALRLYDRREERREQRRRAEAHRRAVDELTPDPDQAEDTEPAGPDHDGSDHDGPDHDSPDSGDHHDSDDHHDPDSGKDQQP